MSQSVGDHRRRGHGGFARLALAGALTAGAMTVVPVAQADSLTSVRSHVHAADAALHKVVAGVGSGSVSGPLALLEKQLGAAGVTSAKLYRSAHHSQSPTARLHAATAMIKLASQENRDATVLTPLIGGLGGSGQSDLAGFVASVTQAREQALTLVSPLLANLPAPVQGQIAGVLAQLSNAGTGQVGLLAGGISPGSIACPAIDAVSQVVATVVSEVPVDLARVQSILSFLPAAGQSQFTAILSSVPGQLSSLVSTLKGAFNCTSTTPVTGLANGPAAGITSLISSVTQLAQSLLGGFLPGIGTGPVTSPVAIPGALSGLLGQVTSVIPGLGSLFGGGSVSGLPAVGGILGGLPVVGGILGGGGGGGLPVVGGIAGGATGGGGIPAVGGGGVPVVGGLPVVGSILSVLGL